MSLIRQLDVPHFMLLCGVHVAVLMLTPYRYWPLMMAAEAITQVPLAIACAPQWGLTWALLKPIPTLLLCAPIVYFFRKRTALLDRKAGVHVGLLLACALIVSVVVMANDMLLFSTIVYPAGTKPAHYDHLAAQWLLGNFLGILAVVPASLAVHRAVRANGWRDTLVKVSESRVALESACFIAPALAVLMWVGFSSPHLRGMVQVAMFLPVVWLALRHGWQGAAFGGTAASLALVGLMPQTYDHATIQAEVVIAFAISTMLLVGGRIEALDRKAERERQEVRTALALAQRNVHLGEMQLRMTAQALEQARETVRAGYSMMLGRLRHLQPAIDDGGYQRVALAAQDQLFGISDSLHPVVWRERGLPAALREGAVARMLDRAGLRYWCELQGQLSCLSSTVHLALYRMVCEAVSEGCSYKDVSDVCVRIRSGESEGRRWVIVSIVFQAHPMRLPHVRWEDLLPRLVRTTSGVGLKAIKDRAATFEGYARERTFPGGRRISWLMRDG
ncbi:MAG TPA: MASE1 domain-containing protein [Dyella sp.]|uniref:MASE1 domain-containing protein n=1 Tax=Dyella sp. TaxID=1869338 RepID=UPI002BFA8494|nr:MASE1 domain-containing protein [Dyella sp.]HTV87073.1 MASE1 domain-containing protein [Dyella sp.]